jgi:hypothetical protein
LILIPSIITLAITILRVVGERQHWSPIFFNPSAGGPGAIVGIAWLPIIFGIYFAVKLRHAGDPTAGPGKAILMAFLGIVIVAGCGVGAHFILPTSQTAQFLVILIGLIIAALLQAFAWRGLFTTSLAYGFAARIPVLIVMFLALKGHWGTHYDAIPPPQPGQPDIFSGMPFMQQFIYLAVLPQIFLWIPYTIILEGLFGGIAGFFAKPKER